MTSGGIDGYGNFSGDDSDYRDWYGFIGQSRDSDVLERSNFEAAVKGLEEIDPDGNDWRAESFGHWACGWVEEVYVRPDTACQTYAEEVRAALADYPVLDEMAFCEAENDEALEIWQNCFCDAGRLDFIRENRGQFDFYDFGHLRQNIRGEDFVGYASEMCAP